MGLDKKNSKRTFRDILDNPTSPENYFGGGYISQGLIKEITLDELAGVKARRENAVVGVFDGYDPSHSDNKHLAILKKLAFELAGGREGNVIYFFVDTSKYKNAYKILEREGLRHGIGFILYFKDKNGQVKTDVFSALPEGMDELYRMLTDPKFSNPVEWVKTNTDLKNPKLILYRDTLYPTYETK